MEKFNVMMEDGTSKEVDCLFYLYNQKYYLIYTEKELDDNGYVLMNIVQVGKEVKNTESGVVDTGYMIGVDSDKPEDNESIQKSITKIVEDKKNSTQSEDIKYLSVSMLPNLKIVSKKTFRLLKAIVEQYFNISFNDTIEKPIEAENSLNNQGFNQNESSSSDVIVDYRTKYFEEQQKSEELEKTIVDLKEKLESIKGIIG